MVRDTWILISGKSLSFFFFSLSLILKRHGWIAIQLCLLFQDITCLASLEYTAPKVTGTSPAGCVGSSALAQQMSWSGCIGRIEMAVNQGSIILTLKMLWRFYRKKCDNWKLYPLCLYHSRSGIISVSQMSPNRENCSYLHAARFHCYWFQFSCLENTPP